MFVKYCFPFLDPIFEDVFYAGCYEINLSRCDKAVGFRIMEMVSEGERNIVGGFNTCGSHVFVTLDHE